MYKAIGFDLGGVMIHYSIPEQTQEIATYFQVEPGKVADALAKLRPSVDTGQIDNHQFWALLLAEIGAEGDPAASESLWSQSYVSKNPYIPGMLELVEQLKIAGYKVGLFSNIDPEHGRINYGRHIFEHFDVALMSNEVHLRKPLASAYQKLAGELGVEASEMIFIDDNAENVTGAEAAGMTGILFTTHDELLQRLRALGINGI